jgi:hypothetical protein
MINGRNGHGCPRSATEGSDDTTCTCRYCTRPYVPTGLCQVCQRRYDAGRPRPTNFDAGYAAGYDAGHDDGVCDAMPIEIVDHRPDRILACQLGTCGHEGVER